MRDALIYLVKSITDHPENAAVAETTDPTGNKVLEISVAAADMGQVIGKGGKIIKALRDLVRILAVKQNTRVSVVLKEG